MINFLGEPMSMDDITNSAKSVKKASRKNLGNEKANELLQKLDFSQESNVTETTNEQPDVIGSSQEGNSKKRCDTSFEDIPKDKKKKKRKITQVPAYSFKLFMKSSDLVKWVDVKNIFQGNHMDIYWPCIVIPKSSFKALDSEILSHLLARFQFPLETTQSLVYLEGFEPKRCLKEFFVVESDLLSDFSTNERMNLNQRKIQAARKSKSRIWTKPLISRYEKILFDLKSGYNLLKKTEKNQIVPQESVETKPDSSNEREIEQSKVDESLETNVLDLKKWESEEITEKILAQRQQKFQNIIENTKSLQKDVKSSIENYINTNENAAGFKHLI